MTKTMYGSKYHIEFLKEVVHKHMQNMPSPIKERIRHVIEDRLTVNPMELGKPLRYSLQGHRCLRIGNYRVIYRIKPKQHAILIVAIKHRKDAYRTH